MVAPGCLCRYFFFFFAEVLEEVDAQNKTGPRRGAGAGAVGEARPTAPLFGGPAT
jgi:hypothetical protein